MNGPLKMYRTKPIVTHDFQVDLPECMYRVKNVHATKNGVIEHRHPDAVAAATTQTRKTVDISEQSKKAIPEMSELEARQDAILEQLVELRNQILSIRADLNLTANTNTGKLVKSISVAETKTANELPSVVVNANPSYPPYSLLFIQRLWADSIFVSIKSHLHSSITKLPPHVEELTENLRSFKSPFDVPVLDVTLIWKDVSSNTQLIITPSGTPIEAEVNLLRFLSRIGPDYFNYETTFNTSEIDLVLDLCYVLLRAQSKTERQVVLQGISTHLGKSQYLCNKCQVSLADVAAYSAIRQISAAGDLNVKMTNWYQRCEEAANKRCC